MTLIIHFCYVHERKIVIQTTPNSVSTTSFPRLCLQRCVTDFFKGPTEEDTHKVLDTIPVSLLKDPDVYFIGPRTL